MVAAVALIDRVLRCVEFSAAIVFPGFAANPAGSGHENSKLCRDLENVAEMKVVL
jgi:hypothetical protein